MAPDDTRPTREVGAPSQTTMAATSKAESSGSSEVLLIVLAGKDVGKIFQLPRDKPLYVIGREDGADVQIVDGDISRRHAAIRYDQRSGHYLLCDLKSRNGTELNGDKCAGEQPIDAGDKIKLGAHTVLRVSRGNEAETRYARKMYQAVLRDGLTGVFNRRYLDERLDGEVAFAVRHDEPLCLLLLDLDHFKAVNDTHGHQAGDVVLQCFAELLQAEVRAEDVVARYGGEEFAVICRQTDETQASALAERLRQAIEHMEVGCEGETIRVTVSSGIATTSAGIDSSHDLVEAADQALYAAKHAGRNRWVLYSSLEPGTSERTAMP